MKKIAIVAAALVSAIGGGILVYYGPSLLKVNTSQYQIAPVTRGVITEEISASGKVEAREKIDLHFKNSGRLTSLRVSVGSKVAEGDVLGKQDSSQLDAQLLEMEAGIDVSKAKLEQILAGASAQDITFAQTAVSNAEVALESSKLSLIDTFRDAYTKSDDAIHNKVDQFFTNARTADPKLAFLVSDNQLQIVIESGRVMAESALMSWSHELANVSTESELVAYITSTKTNLAQIKTFLDYVASAVNVLMPSANYSQTTIDKWKSDVSTARSNMNAAISNVTSASNSLTDKAGDLKSAKDQLAIKQAPARAPDISLSQAQIKQSQAQAARIKALIADMAIVAPISGMVTAINGAIGEIITPDVTVVSLIPNGALQIKLNVSENDIPNLKVGQVARISLDAFPDETFEGKVVMIDPAETIIGGAVYYQTTIVFMISDNRVKSGMTAEVYIDTATSVDALLVPASAVFEKDGKKYVRLLFGSQLVDTNVTAGLKDTRGQVELLSGVKEGDLVVTGEK